MIWNNIELFNVDEVEKRTDGALKMYRFPKSTRDCFLNSCQHYSVGVGCLTTGCELRFVGKMANILLSAEDCDGTVEIFRGDFLCRVERLQAGVVKRIELRENTALDSLYPDGYQGRFSPDVWRIVFDHDVSVVLHDVQALSPIRPPMQNEIPSKKILAYGSSITHSACSILYTNSYIYTVGRKLGADVLCKGMGGSCHCQNEIADYIAGADWDVAILELGINMVESYPVSLFEERATYLVKRALERGKPVVLISNFMSYENLPSAKFHQANDEYVACLESIYSRLKCDHLYYIRGQEILDEWDLLTADLIHPSPYGHGEMGRKIAKKLRDEFGIL